MREIRIAYINCNGLNGKAPGIRKYVRSMGIDILCLGETWMKKNSVSAVKNAVVDMRKERNTQGIGGRIGIEGIMVVVQPRIRDKVRVLHEGSTNNWCAIEIGSLQIICGYFSPSMSIKDFEEIFSEICKIPGIEIENTIMVGDWNARHSKLGNNVNSRRGKKLIQIMQEKNEECAK